MWWVIASEKKRFCFPHIILVLEFVKFVCIVNNVHKSLCFVLKMLICLFLTVHEQWLYSLSAFIYHWSMLALSKYKKGKARFYSSWAWGSIDQDNKVNRSANSLPNVIWCFFFQVSQNIDFKIVADIKMMA